MNICIECRRLMRVWLIYAIVFFVISKGYNITPALFLMLISFALFSSLGIWAAIIEVIAVFLPALILYFLTDNIFIIYLLPFVNICLIMAYRAGRNMAYILSTIYIIFWIYLSYTYKLSTIDYVIICICIFNMLLHFKGLFLKHNESINWDFISEKNDELLNKNIIDILKEGLYDIKGSVRSVQEIKNIQNNLVIHVNVKYFTINIKYLAELYKNLPKGENKKAFIIYSCNIFPDMAYIPLWVILSLKGYKVCGRAYYIKSLAEIKFANIYFAANKDMLQIMKKGIYDMADGFRSALPFHFYLLPFSIIAYFISYIKYKVSRVN